VRVCVFCGSSPAARATHHDATVALGEALVASGCGLVYGGAQVGLMGVLADVVLAAGGEVVGVLPASLSSREIAHDGLTELHIVEGMLERKALMASRSDAFAALPGGMGTLDELFEMLTWGQLGLHPVAKPVGLLNVDGFFDDLLAFLDRATADGFVRPHDRAALLVDDTPAGLLHQLGATQP
jgi:uncharacterized protein (TIGR00730 family)